MQTASGHTPAEAAGGRCTGVPGRAPLGETAAILRSASSSALWENLKTRLPPRAGGRPQPTQGRRGPSLGRQLQLFGLQVLLSADKLFPNSQPGVRKHLMSLARLGLAPRPGDGRGWRSRFAGCHLDESEESLSHSRRGGI